MLTVGISHISSAIAEPAYPDAKITVKVVAESGNPIAAADVSVGFNQGGDAWVGEGKSESISGVSDTNGLFSAQARCAGHIGIRVDKEGYYRSFSDYDYPGTYQNKKRWEPWNPTNRVVLKEIKNPIPMYVKSVRAVIPELNKKIGFDLEKGDWVAPYGKGVISDFIFYATYKERSDYDYDYSLLLTFPNDADGIQTVPSDQVHYQSKFKSDYCAPRDGYNSKWEQYRIRRPQEGETNNVDRGRQYYFRVRTKMNTEGKVAEALYGKIHGDFLDFTYYFNPTPNDRNLEFDPDKNLFGGLERFAP